MSLRLEYVGIIAMACLAIGLFVGSSFGSGSKSNINSASLVELGNAAFDSGSPKVAILAYEKALQINPNNPDVLTDVGTMYLRTGDLAKATASFRQAASQDPRHVKSRFNLGIALMSSKKYGEAATAFKECLDIAPKGELAAAAKAHLDIIDKKAKKP
jgi:cytochrome c-type biogenesis protein CcmH/NrfG